MGAEGEFLIVALDYMEVFGLGGAGPGFELCLQWNVELPGRHSLFTGFDDRRFSGESPARPAVHVWLGADTGTVVKGWPGLAVIIQYGIAVFMGIRVMRTRLAEAWEWNMIIPRLSSKFRCYGSLFRQPSIFSCSRLDFT